MKSILARVTTILLIPALGTDPIFASAAAEKSYTSTQIVDSVNLCALKRNLFKNIPSVSPIRCPSRLARHSH